MDFSPLVLILAQCISEPVKWRRYLSTVCTEFLSFPTATTSGSTLLQWHNPLTA